jgi:hypothetical protein
MTDQPLLADRPRRPLGVVIVAATQLLRAVLLLAQVLRVDLFPGFDWLQSAAQLPEPAPDTAAFLLTRSIGVALTAASVAVAVGLLANRRWGWIGAIVLSGLALALGIGAWWDNNPAYVALAINVVAVFYLNQREVRIFYEDPSASTFPVRP